ncbi:hypothetical protein NDU88_007264 [Pleurodeles waltl]|uniref:Uncharacterized protein n=1 Tax=Pleurodeles waltl TaxID=8319 RepID=A0AAV7SS40_PLEWA|nr:hypothetical protein NDU88_007264 [Pleurodeles waltl]
MLTANAETILLPPADPRGPEQRSQAVAKGTPATPHLDHVVVLTDIFEQHGAVVEEAVHRPHPPGPKQSAAEPAAERSQPKPRPRECTPPTESSGVVALLGRPGPSRISRIRGESEAVAVALGRRTLSATWIAKWQKKWQIRAVSPQETQRSPRAR